MRLFGHPLLSKTSLLTLLFFPTNSPAQTVQSSNTDVSCQVLLHVAGDCGYRGEAKRHAAAAKMLVEQLRSSGVPESQLIRVDGQPLSSLTKTLLEVASAAGEDNTLIVILLGVGSTRGAQDLLLAPDGSDSEAAIPIQRILDLMDTSVSRRQLLIVDGSVSEVTSKLLKSSQEFGNSKLRLYAGQSALLSRCTTLRGETPLFIAAVADAMTELADQAGERAINPGDGVITETEFTQYLASYAEYYGIKPTPRISSDSSENFPIITAARLDEASRLRPQSRQQLIDFLLHTAYLSLLVENKPNEARLALQRALSYRPQPGQREEIVGLWLTSLCADGLWETAWQVAAERGQPLLMMAPRDLQLLSGNRVIASMRGSEILQLSKRQGGILTVQQVLRPTFSSEGISIDADPQLKNTFIRETSLPTTEKTAETARRPEKNRDEARRLIDILREIEAK
jgi:hypothetical protein